MAGWSKGELVTEGCMMKVFARASLVVFSVVLGCTNATIGERSGEPIDNLIAACSDGIDNDGDGLTDFDDPGCISPSDVSELDEVLPVCSDGIDNDGDGLLDYPEDPGCLFSSAGSEVDDCPNGASCPACSNGKDDDGDGKVDYPADPNCDSAGDTNEGSTTGNVCGADVSLEELTQGAPSFGQLDTDDVSELISPTCGGAGSERVYRFTIDAPRSLRASTVDGQTTADTVLYLRGECRDTTTELSCSDDFEGANASEIFVERIEAGTYYLVVDAFRATDSGSYKLTTEFTVPDGASCQVGGHPCQAGLTCRKLTPSAPTTTCEKPACGDGVDSDGDGLVDFPNDPGCTDLNDVDETDDCPDGPNCPVCSNGKDDDGDDKVDYPEDGACTSANDTSEQECGDEEDPIELITEGNTASTTEGASDDSMGSCGGGGEADRVHVLNIASELESLRIDTVGSEVDTVLYVRGPDSCDSEEIECNDDGPGADDGNSIIELDETSPGTYFIVVDGYTDAGAYELNVRGVIKKGEACEEETIDAGIFECAEGSSCTDSVCS